ncbi:MAG: U32 family peptidase [Nitrospira sp.]|nr:U32 family peptidase [bacterium]MBL7049162.1 U32 family peptidase [Nitrospira sp.]
MKPELLAPAGNFEKLSTALHYGADAVYMGLSEFSLRAKADNFTIDDLKKAAEYVRQMGKKFYITINIIPHNRDIVLIHNHLQALAEIKPDAIILSDTGAFELTAEILPETPIHISTQANITNFRAAKFWERLGAKRLVIARELSIAEIRGIREQVSLELECFVHGAICISYSGRCYISSLLSNRSGNQGACTNSCRWNFVLMEAQRPGSYMPVYENDKGTYVMSSRDLCMIAHLHLLAESGVNSFKIEGRTKGVNYVAGVVKTYRDAIDNLEKSPYTVKDTWTSELAMISNRGYTTGMMLGPQSHDSYNHDEEKVYRMTHEFVGVVRQVTDGKAIIDLRNTLTTGDTIEFLSVNALNPSMTVQDIQNEKGVAVEIGRNEDSVIIDVMPGVQAKDIIRRRLK